MSKRRRKKYYSRSRNEPLGTIGSIIIIAIIAFVILKVLWEYWIYVLITLILILAFIIYRLIKKYQRNKMITSDIDNYLRNALEVMDTTGRWYNNEEEANRELVSCLKTQKIDAIYQYRLPNGRTADAKVGNVLVEGKLSPSTADVDRLLGQLTEYTKFPEKTNVVIYGKLYKEARKRIENEIVHRYQNKVFITYLDNPKRQRG